jgi:hypothetical protein
MTVPLGSTTVTAVRRTKGTPDRLGVPTMTETTWDITGCSFQPVMSMPAENQSNIDMSISFWRLFAPPNTGLVVTDAIRYNGDTYEIHGDPQTWPDPVTGSPNHTEFWLRKARG